MNNYDESYYVDLGISQSLSILLSISIIIISLIGFSLDKSYKSRFIWIVNLFWSSLLLLNRFRLSGLQIEWTHLEQILINLLIFLPSIAILYLISILPNNRDKFIYKADLLRGISDHQAAVVKRVVIAMIMIISIIFTIDLIIYDAPLFSLNLGTVSLNDARTDARLPILFTFAHSWVLITVIACSMIFFSKGIARNWLYLMVLLYTVHSILMFGRGSIIYFLSAILLCFFVFSQRSNLNKVLLTIVPVISVLILFSLAGTLRQGVGAGGSLIQFSVVEYGLFRPNIPEFFSWLYGYAIINFDNLILCIRDFDARGAIGFKTLLNFAPSFIGELLGMDYSSRASQGIQSLPYVGRFNLPTAYGSIGFDYGWVGVYMYSFFVFSLVPTFFHKNFSNLGVTSKIFLMYLLLSFLFITISNMILTSRILGFISVIILFQLLFVVLKPKKINVF